MVIRTAQFIVKSQNDTESELRFVLFVFAVIKIKKCEKKTVTTKTIK